jgi:hypothetical protein
MELLRRTCLKTLAAGMAVPSVFGAASGKDAELTYDAGRKYVLKPGGALPPDEVKILGGFLQEYTPPSAEMNPNGGWTAVYDILHFEGPKKVKNMLITNKVAGQVAITRSSASPEYRVRQKYIPTHSEEEISVSVRCNPDEIRSVQDYEMVWKCASFMRREAGSVQSSALKVAAGPGVESLEVKHPVAAFWTLLDAVRLLPESVAENCRFDLFMDLSSLRRNQTLRFTRSGAIRTAAGALPVRFCQQTGQGVVPIHYAIDGQNRTLFATQGQLGWALSRIERA